jgi:hypothetical protein
MQPSSTPTYKSLSFVEKWRVIFLLRRGRAAADSRIAQATVEFGEEWQQRHSRRYRLFTVVVGPIVVATIVLAATWGDTLYLVMQAVFLGLILLNAMIVPAFWPRRLARSIESSRQVAARG